MKKLQTTIAFFCFLCLLACKKTDDPKPYVNPTFTPYLNTFIEEGKKRGINFTPEQQAITIKLSNLSVKTGYSGLANSETRTIDVDSTVWLTYPELRKERLIYHELGHLMLGRKHNPFKLPNGECVSLMWTNEDNPDKCSAPIFAGNLRRTYYFDELFNERASTPAWSTDNTTWKEPTQTTQTVVVGPNNWNKNDKLDALVLNSPNKVSYKILPNGMSVLVGKQTSGLGFELPLTTLFPILSEATLQNYEVRLRYKLYGRSFDIFWEANNNPKNFYSTSSNICGENNFLGIDDGKLGFFFNKQLPHDPMTTHELVLRHKDNYVMIWLNGQPLFQTDVAAGTGVAPLKMSLFLSASQYDFEFITVTRL